VHEVGAVDFGDVHFDYHCIISMSFIYRWDVSVANP